MLTKIANWMDKPWTNGTYCKLCAMTLAVYGVIMAAYAAFIWWDEIREKIDNLCDKVTGFFTSHVVIHRGDEAE